MIDDPIVAEVHQARDDYARQFNYDIDAIFDDLRRMQTQPGVRVVSFPPQRPDEQPTEVLQETPATVPPA